MNPPSWPKGEDKELVVFSGQIYKAEATDIWDFESITVQRGGILEIAQGHAWTIIGCKGDCQINGIVRAMKGDYSSSGMIRSQAPDGYLLEANCVVKNGGNGGNGATNNLHSARGGFQSSGNGGGGAAPYSNGGDAGANVGGNGGQTPPPGNNWRCAGGGAGGTLGAPVGAQGGGINDPNLNHGGATGGGGGGGARGFHGGLLYLRVLGNLDAVGGTFEFAGQPGGPGGNGGSVDVTHFQNDIKGGAGGGGGAGGSGGFVIIRHAKSYSSGIIKVDPGFGGLAGSPGSQSFNQQPHSQPGSPGQNGQNGFADVIKAA
jgi:hypothetical protein